MTDFEKCKEIVKAANQLTNHVNREITVRPYTFEGREMRVITHNIVEGVLSLHVFIEHLVGRTCVVRRNEGQLPVAFEGFIEECTVFVIAYLRGVHFSVQKGDRSMTCLESLRGVKPDRRHVNGMYVVTSLLRRINRLAVWPEDAAAAYLTYRNKIPNTFVTVDRSEPFQCHRFRVYTSGEALYAHGLYVYRNGDTQTKGEIVTRYPQSVLDLP